MRHLCFLFIISALPVATNDISAADEPATDTKSAAEQLLGIIDAVIDNHIAPPTRQEMLLRGCRALLHEDDLDTQASLSRDISDLSGKREMTSFLANKLAEANGPSPHAIEQRFLGGTLLAIPGGARFSKAKDYAVEQQLRENRYVGIGIALSMQGKFPAMPQVIPGGPAYVAGGRNGDLMIKIDGNDAAQFSLEQIIEILRGQEGKPVTIVVRQPNSDEERTLNIVRGTVPFGSIEGLRRDENDNWVYRSDDASDIGYLKLTAVRGSSARELKEAARKLHASSLRALILDLRSTSLQGDLRHAAMIADELLGAGPIGSAVVNGKTEEFVSSPDQLFAGWPIAVLVGSQTQGQAEWIAAALQDHKRAIIVGQPTLGVGFVEKNIKLDNGDVISLRGGVLRRGDGKALTSLGQQFGSMSGATRVRVSPSGTSVDERIASGWRGVKPDGRVPGQGAVAKAIELLSQALRKLQDTTAAE